MGHFSADNNPPVELSLFMRDHTEERVPRFPTGMLVKFCNHRTDRRVLGIIVDAPDDATADYGIFAEGRVMTVWWAAIGSP